MSSEPGSQIKLLHLVSLSDPTYYLAGFIRNDPFFTHMPFSLTAFIRVFNPSKLVYLVTADNLAALVVVMVGFVYL